MDDGGARHAQDGGPDAVVDADEAPRVGRHRAPRPADDEPAGVGLPTSDGTDGARASAAGDEIAPDRSADHAGDEPPPVARTTAPADVHPTDRIRQVVVGASAAGAVVGAFLGSGAVGGTPIQDAAGGALAADATLVAPGSGAFVIWTPIYLGLIAVAVVQALPGRATDPAHRATGWFFAAAMLLNAAWILQAQAGRLGLTVAVIAALVAILGLLAQLLTARRPRRRADAVGVDVTVGLYLGWASVATVANVAAALAAAGVRPQGAAAHVWGVVVVGVAAAIGVAGTLALSRDARAATAASAPVSVATRPTLAVGFALATTWGLAWIAVGRLTAGPDSPPVAIAGVVAAVAVLAAAIGAVVRGRRLRDG